MIKYTKEILEKYVSGSLYLSDMIRKMGLGSNSTYIRYIGRKIKDFNIDTSHWLSQPEIGKLLYNKKNKTNNVFVIGRKDTKQLRNAMIKDGINYSCNICGLENKWQDREIVLQIDHINGNNIDNRKENLRFLCPNCHSQTNTFGAKNHRPQKKRINYCVSCFAVINKKSKRCRTCNTNNYISPQKPSKEELEKLIWEMPMVKIKAKFNVSDKTIKDWAVNYNIEIPKRGHWLKKQAS